MNPVYVRDFMNTIVVTIDVRDSLSRALEEMQRGRLRHLVVVDGERVVGVVSERDVHAALPSPLAGGSEEGYDHALATIPVGRTMVRGPLTVSPETPAREAVVLLLRYRIGCLPVVCGKKVVGILTRTDCLDLLSRLMYRSHPRTRPSTAISRAAGEEHPIPRS